MADKEVDEKLLRKYYMQTFSTEGGHIVLKDLENRCFKRDTTAAGGKDEMVLNEGKRQVLLHIEGMMSHEGIANLAAEPEKGSD